MKAKIILAMGYRKFVVDADKALKVVELLHDAELYEIKYHSAVNGRDSYNTHHVYENDDSTSNIGIELMPESMYAVSKLAGKPDKD